MYNTAPEFRTLMAEPSRTLSARGLITYPDLAQQSLTAAMISSIRIDEDAGDHLPLGTAGASTLTLKLDNRGGEWEQGGSIRGNRKMEGAEISLEMGVFGDSDYEWEPLGVYVLEDATGQEQDTTITFRGADYLANKAVRAYIDDLIYPATLDDMANLACFQSGMILKTGGFPNSNVSIAERPEWDGNISCREALGFIAEAAGGFVRVDRNGEVEIVSLAPTKGWLDDLYDSSFDVDGAGDLIFETPGGYSGPEFEIDDIDLTVDAENVVEMVDGEIHIIAFSDDQNYFVTPARYKRLTKQAEIFKLNAIIFEGRAETETSEPIAPVRYADDPGLVDGVLNSVSILNPLLIPGTASYTSLKGVLEGLTGLETAGAMVEWQGDPTVTTGDFLRIMDMQGNQHTVIVTRNVLTISPGFEMESGTVLKNDAQVGTFASKPRIFTPDGKLNAAAIGGVIERLQIAIGAIGSAQIDDLSVEMGHFKEATINALKADAIAAFTARIEYLIANELYTDELYAAMAEIADLRVGVANIDWANIKDLVSGRQIFTSGVGDQLFIADLAVTEANMLSLTVGELIVRGADGGFYALTVDGQGNIKTEQKKIVGGDITDSAIDGSTKIIENSITASRLNANDIFANSAIIKELMAANIDVDTFFARQGVINELTLNYVTPLNDAITFVSNDISESIDNLDSINFSRFETINNTIATLRGYLEEIEDAAGENNSITTSAISTINLAIAALTNEASTIINDVEHLQEARTLTDQYIRVGLLYIDGNNIPRHGVAVGENLTTVTDQHGNVVVERAGLACTMTSDRISFWQMGAEVAYFANGELWVKAVRTNELIIEDSAQTIAAVIKVEPTIGLTIRV